MIMPASKMVLLLISGTFALGWGWPSAKYKYRVKAKDFPYVVRLTIDKSGRQMICTGSLIHPQWVLTAAHCTTGYTSIRVNTAVTNTGRERANLNKELSAAKSTSYPGFVNNLAPIGMNLNNDYSLIRLESSFEVDNVNIGLVRLENRTWIDDKERICLGVGFGSKHDEDGLYVFSVKARHGACPCKTKQFLLNRYICSEVDENYGSSICPGDSGGPLICNDKQVGIASYTYPSNGCDLLSTRSSKDFGCNVPGTVSVFTYVCPVLSWIRKYVGEGIPTQPINC